MRRVHTTFDLLEAHIMTGLLRAQGVEAHAFDVGMVRQDWFRMIAFGGFRIVVSDPAVDDAIAVLGRYANGDFALADADQDRCPRCGAFSVLHDPQPRRNVFLAMFLLPLFELVTWSWFGKFSAEAIAALFALQVVAYLTLPWFVVHYFKWRMRCLDCDLRWRRTPKRHADLVRMAVAGVNFER